VPASEGAKIGSGRTQGAVRGRASKKPFPALLNQFEKRMKVYAYTATTAILVALLIGVGWLYKVEKVQSTDSILMFILAQVLGAWVGLTNKIFRIISSNTEKESN
jgi:hypothetical protein